MFILGGLLSFDIFFVSQNEKSSNKTLDDAIERKSSWEKLKMFSQTKSVLLPFLMPIFLNLPQQNTVVKNNQSGLISIY